MENTPLISVIVPVYNVEPFLRRCINSIISQTYRNLEIILVNDGSTDNCGKICDEYAKNDNRVVVIHKDNGGLSSARNAGLGAASGQYVGFVDSDDWITLDMYETLYSMFHETNCDVAQVATMAVADTDASLPDRKHEPKSIKGKDILRKYLFDGLLSRHESHSVWSKLYKLKLFDTVKFPEGFIYEDIATNYKILLKCDKFAYTEKYCHYYFTNNSSITRRGANKKDFDIFIAFDELYELARDETYKDIAYLAKIKRDRCDYWMLAKIAAYGADFSAEDKRRIIKQLTKRLRDNYVALMKAPLTITRKILMTALCVNFNIAKVSLGIYKLIVSMRSN
jgi:glycosyltransferase involved in cell wall biosynthesis